MSRLQVPLDYRRLHASGDILLRAEIELLIKLQSGAWDQQTFRVDSGTEMTTMLAALAKHLGVPIPQQPVPLAVHAQTGMEFRSGFLRVRVVAMDATEYVIPCFFLGDPDGPIPPSRNPTASRKLLGLSGVINQLRLSFDGDPRASAPYGDLIVEKK